VVGADAVAHRVWTEPEHRRRGLASVLMGVLVHAAVAEGATTGILFASAEGAHLYARLGWQKVSGLVVARNDRADVQPWVDLDAVARQACLEDTTGPGPDDAVEGEHELEGLFVTDEPGFHLALGEALLGPGRHFGRTLDDLRVHLAARSGFTLRKWHQWYVASAAMPAYFERAFALLNEYGVLDSRLSALVAEHHPHFVLSRQVCRWYQAWCKTIGREPRNPSLNMLPGRDGEVVVTSSDSPNFHVSVNTEHADRLVYPTIDVDDVLAHARLRGRPAGPLEKFLRTDLTVPTEIPEGCTVSVTRGEVISVRITRDGELVGSGTIGVHGEDAAPHDISGQFEVVLGVLVDQARKAGARTGSVMTAEPGRYRGWTEVSDVVVLLKP
jgi:hypothetical protein